jgi:hypothetical protein
MKIRFISEHWVADPDDPTKKWTPWELGWYPMSRQVGGPHLYDAPGPLSKYDLATGQWTRDDYNGFLAGRGTVGTGAFRCQYRSFWARDDSGKLGERFENSTVKEADAELTLGMGQNRGTQYRLRLNRYSVTRLVVNADDVVDAKRYAVDYLQPMGTLVLANTNFDGKLDGGRKRDCDDEQANGAADLDDVGVVKLHKLGVTADEIPGEMTVKLELLNPDRDTTGLTAAQKAHVFDGRQNNSTVMLGGTKLVSVVYKKTPGAGERNISDLAGAGNLELGIEGVEYGTEVVVKLTVSIGSQKLLEDDQRILVSPFLVTSNTGTLKRAFVGTTTNPAEAEVKAFGDAFVAQLGNTPVTQVDASEYSDGWVQDCMEIGFSRTAAAGATGFREMNTVLDLSRPLGLGKLPSELSTNKYNLNLGYVKVIQAVLNEDETRHNGGGNIEASPPIAGSQWPVGRIVCGSGIHPTLKAFLERQKVQVGSSGLLMKDTSWLAVGHVDEIVSFCKIGGNNRMLVAAPQEGMALWQQAGGAYATLAAMTVANFFLNVLHADQATINNIPAATRALTLQQYNEGLWNDHLNAISQQLCSEVGLNAADIVQIPVVFLPDPNTNGRAATLAFPDRVNLFVRGDGSFVVPDNPNAATDPLRPVVQQRLGIQANAFVNSFGLFTRYGDVHCASNAVRSGPATKEWPNQ